jgi:hypothetical protein
MARSPFGLFGNGADYGARTATFAFIVVGGNKKAVLF